VPFGVRSKFDELVRVCQTLQHASAKIARDSSPPIQSHSFLAVKIASAIICV